jgi:hypothetical protein
MLRKRGESKHRENGHHFPFSHCCSDLFLPGMKPRKRGKEEKEEERSAPWYSLHSDRNLRERTEYL